MSNLHLNLDEANKHTPKGFDPAGNNTRPWKDEQGQSTYTENFELPRAINFVDGTVAPPTTADLDVYVLTGSGVVDSGWGTATFGDWVRFLNGIAAPITPLAGALCYDDTASSWMEFDGSVWAAFGGGGGGPTLYTANNTIGTSRVATLTDSLTFDASGVGGDSLIFQGGSNANKGFYLYGSTGTTGSNYRAALVNISSGARGQLVLRSAAGDTTLNTDGISTLQGGLNSIGAVNISPSTAAYNLNVKQPNGANGIRMYTANGQNELHLHHSGGATAVVRFLSGSDCYVNTSGNFGIGLSSGFGAKLHVKGSGITSGTTALLVENSAGQNIIEARNDNALAFYGGVPTVQATTGIAAAVFAANTSGIADDTATFDGYTIGQVVTALRAMGILT